MVGYGWVRTVLSKLFFLLLSLSLSLLFLYLCLYFSFSLLHMCVHACHRTIDGAEGSRDHQKPSVKHQETSRQEPGTHVAHHQGDPEGLLHTIQ